MPVETAEIIDAHQHLWAYNEDEFSWITAEMPAIRRSFGPDDLRTVIAASGVAATIAVQARACEQENRFLLAAAAHLPAIAGVVGWVDLCAPDCGEALDRWTTHHSFKGVREICQGAPDAQYFDNSDFHCGIREVTRRGLTYDLLVFDHQLAAATGFADSHPDQPMVLDHGGKPAIRGAEAPAEWSRAIRELARREHVCCKLSGLCTEVPNGLSADSARMRPCFEVLLENFGPQRLMFGSDWPVALLAMEYANWLSIVTGWLAPLSAGERGAILGGNARRFYGISSDGEKT